MGRWTGFGSSPAKPVRARRGSMAAAVALVLAGQATVAQAARQYEVDPDGLDKAAWTRAKQIVRERDSWACAECGGLACDVHHRVRRGSGGTGNPAIEFSPANLICLCRPDHNRAHAKDEGMRERGLWLTTDQNPADEPVYVRSEWGRERFWLLSNGKLSRADPRRAAA